MTTSPIFVRGISRSGGTLMTTILDAHPDIAMGYEIYENLLVLDDDPVSSSQHPQPDPERFVALFAQPGSANIDKFAARAKRCGVSRDALVQLAREHIKGGFGFADFQGRMLFVQRIVMKKALAEGKRAWGTKIVSSYDQLDMVFPDAKYLFMLRDGRDIAASRRRVGKFQQTVEYIADSWCKQIEKFENFSKNAAGRALFVPYEKLAENPESTLRKLTQGLDIPWSDRLINYFKLDLSIYRDATGHLSRDQVRKPINTASIGRWKQELSREEVAQFEERAGSTLERYGYR